MKLSPQVKRGRLLEHGFAFAFITFIDRTHRWLFVLVAAPNVSVLSLVCGIGNFTIADCGDFDCLEASCLERFARKNGAALFISCRFGFCFGFS